MGGAGRIPLPKDWMGGKGCRQAVHQVWTVTVSSSAGGGTSGGVDGIYKQALHPKICEHALNRMSKRFA